MEGKVKELRGTHPVTVDKFRGSVDNVLPEIADKYAGKKTKKNLLEKIGTAFDKAGEHIEKLIKEDD